MNLRPARFLLALGLVASIVLLAPSGASARREGADEKKIDRFPAAWHWASTTKQLDGCYARVGSKAPPLIVDAGLGERVRDEDLAGRILIVDFWATWCAPCIQAIPHHNSLVERYADRGVVLFGVCCTRGSEKIKRVAESHPMRYPSVIDQSNRTAIGWGVQWWPYVVIVDRNGIIRAAGLHPDRVDDVVDALLEEQPHEPQAE